MNIIAASCMFPSGPGMGLAEVALKLQLALNRQHPFYVDRCGNPIFASFFPKPGSFDVQRWIMLAKATLQDLFRQRSLTGIDGVQPQYSLWLVLPPAARAGVPVNLADQLLAACQDGPVTLSHMSVILGGHAAAAQALSQASQFLTQSNANNPQVAIVMAIDSWLHPDALIWLEQHDLLHNAAKPWKGSLHKNPYGRIPGEAAAAVMLSASDSPAWCAIAGIGLANETVLRGDTRPCTGMAWTQAARQALATLPSNSKITHVFSDLNGEPYRAEQFGFTILRIDNHLAGDWKQYTPALITADVGTTTLLLHTALSANMLRQDNMGASHLLLAGSDDHLRAAIALVNA